MESVHLEINEQQKQALSKAASMSQVSVDQFILDHACSAATKLLDNETQFILNKTQWGEFCAALDSPPKQVLELKELFNKPAPFHD